MYAAIRSYPRIDRACEPEEVVRAGRACAAILDRAQGFISCFVLETQRGGLTVVSLFDEHANLEAADQVEFDRLLGLRGSAEAVQGEVVFQRGL